VIFQRETVVQQVPVTTYQPRWVDQGHYRMVWVSQPAVRQVPSTTYRPVMGYRVVPYQRMAPGVAAPQAAPATTQSDPASVTARRVSSTTTATRGTTSSLKPNTAQRAWMARPRLGR
tara:strand:+ start:338 stop:688 length:351 start_codon:yes stop_codon:yes gene_type:complete